MSLSKYLLAGLGVTVLGAGIVWLSRESDEGLKLDLSKHTLEKLHEILEELYMEHALAYVFYNNMMNNLKE